MNFEQKVIEVPPHDCDVVLRWPNGVKVTIQIRPSNVDVGGYAGSLDFLLPEPQCVTCWIGDDITPAPIAGGFWREEHERNANRLVAAMYDSWYGKQPLKRVKFEDIRWDTDANESHSLDLPESVILYVPVDMNVVSEGADFLSARYGRCVSSFNFNE